MRNVRTEALIIVVLLVTVPQAGYQLYRWAYPADPPAPVVTADPEMVIVISDGKRVPDEAIEKAAAKLTVGSYTVQAIPRPGEAGWTRFVVVSDSPGPVIPTPPQPVPPLPVPPQPQPPQPTPPPAVEGKRAMLIVRESGDDTPAFARLVNALRNGPSADYLKSKGHSFDMLDAQAQDENDQPSPIVKAWEPFYRDLTLPVLLIVDPATRQLVHREALGPAATADSVIATLKGHGG